MWCAQDVATGAACGCTCPGCSRALVACNRGEVQQPHFRHRTALACPGAFESAVHRMAKQILVEAQHVQLPEWAGTRAMPSPPKAMDVHGITWAGRYVFRAARLAALLHAEVERAIGGIRPDVLAHDAEGALLLEVRVTHRVERAKREVVQARRYRMVEIDLSRVTFEDVVDPHRFTDLVLYEAKNRHWISLPDAEDEWRDALADLERDVAAAPADATEPPIEPRVPAYVDDSPLRMPPPPGTVVAARTSQFRTAAVGSRLWHSGHGTGVVIGQMANTQVYMVAFDGHGERAIVLDARSEDIEWKVLADPSA